MANISHKTLTGAQLHENKGSDTAADDTVATVTGHATVWKKLTAANLTGTGNSFGGQLLQVRYQLSPNTAGFTPVAATWTDTPLNTTLTNEISGATLSVNQLSLPAGTYFCDGVVPTVGVTGVLRMRNITDNATLLTGIAGFGTFFNSVWVGSYPTIKGRFTLSGTKTVSFQYFFRGYVSQFASANTGESDTYADLMIWKVA